MFRATNSPILRSTFWLYIQLLVQCTDTAADRCHGGTGCHRCRCIVPKAVYTVKKCSWEWANLSPKTCRAELKRLINEKICCIFLVIYIVVLKWWMATQTSCPFCIWYLETPILSWSHYYSASANKSWFAFQNTLCQTTYCMMERNNERQILTVKICIMRGFMTFTPPNAVIKWRRKR